MAVSKVAVIALVAVIAVPILLGYALNLTETTETDYKATGESVNVTGLLQNGTEYTYSKATSYQLNTNFSQQAIKIYPDYKTITTTKTSFKSNVASVSGTDIIYTGAVLDSYSVLSYEATYKMSEGYITMNYTTSGGISGSIPYFHSLYYEPTVYGPIVSYYTSDTTVTAIVISDMAQITGFTKTGSYNGYMYVLYNYPAEPFYINLADGYRFKNNGLCFVDLPSHTKSVLFTVDLDSITDPTYKIEFSTPAGRFNYALQKTTTDGVVSWQLLGNSQSRDLYYNPAISNNTYQIYTELNKVSSDSTYDYYTSHNEFRYVGSWPQLFGAANSYLTIADDINYSVSAGTDQNINYIEFRNMAGNISPVMRFDDASFRAFTYQAIINQTYSPSSFKSNPVTTISNITNYGSSLTFGGHTYTVSNNKITLGGKQISIEGLKLISVPDGNGNYNNRIGNTVISTTAQPSMITFNGSWSASISTDSMESYTYTHTEWIPGHFGWDGVDHNFLIVGLLTCIGVFVALGIYARKRGSGGLIPLMIVTGCAAAVFFIML